MNDEQLRKKLVSAARKVCTSECIASFECGKSKSSFGHIPLFGTNTVCPLQKYDICHEDKPKDMLSRLRNDPTLDDMDLLCEFCDHRDKSKDTEKSFSMENCFETHCMDCPVQSYREGIQELCAEARMS